MRRLIPIIVLLSACAAPRDVPRLHEGWEYSLDGRTWREELRPDGVHDYRMRVRVPQSRFTHAVVRAYAGEFEVFAGGRRIYSFREPRSDGRLALHVIPLRPDTTLLIRIPRPRDVTLFGGAPYLATADTLPLTLERAAFDPLRESASDILLGVFLFVIGVIAFAASLLRRRGDPLALRSFGVFMLLYGARLLVDSYLPLALGGSVQTFAFLASFITYVIPIAGWALPLHLIGNGWRSSLRLQVIAFALFAPIGIASDLFTHTPGSLDMVNNVLIVIGAVNILLNLVRAERRTLELKIVIAGALVFLVFALNNNLVSLGVLPWTFSDETFGFVVCVAALGYAATRAFLRGERERLAIDNELTTAREIQRSILPTAMPDVRGLRVQAAYDPASSVAGDLYDFVRADEHRVGVLVADVAGHGVPAALIASMVKIAFSSQSRLAPDPAALMQQLNETLRHEVRRAFVTATYLWFDVEQRSVTVCNAGHAPPLLLRDGAFHELGPAGVLLGRFATARYTATTTELRPGDRVVAFTDGIIEARNGRDEQFGEERLRAAIAHAIPQDVITEVHQWRAGADSAEADDLTVVMVDFTTASNA